jgi:hypothetical protein
LEEEKPEFIFSVDSKDGALNHKKEKRIKPGAIPTPGCGLKKRVDEKNAAGHTQDDT